MSGPKDSSIGSSKPLIKKVAKHVIIGIAVFLVLFLLGYKSIQKTANIKSNEAGKDDVENVATNQSATLNNDQVNALIEKLRIATESERIAQSVVQEKNETILKLQDEILTISDQNFLLREELELRHKVNVEKLLKEQEDKIRKSSLQKSQEMIALQERKDKIASEKNSIESQIVSKWSPPKDKHNETVIIKYSIDASGRIMNVNFIQKSSSPDVDNSVLSALTAASPFKISNDPILKDLHKEIVSKFVLP